ncbi:MAG: hypothetical protein RL226_172 [Bacteroidota bacterium]
MIILAFFPYLIESRSKDAAGELHGSFVSLTSLIWSRGISISFAKSHEMTRESCVIVYRKECMNFSRIKRKRANPAANQYLFWAIAKKMMAVMGTEMNNTRKVLTPDLNV